MKINIFPLTADAATIAARRQNRRGAGKLQRKRKMPEISPRLIAAAATAAAASLLCLSLSLSLSVCAAQESDDEGELHHLDQLHHQHQDFIIGESEEHDHIAHHLAEMQNKDELLEDIREDTVVNAIPEKDLPKFGELLQNVTVPVSREAILQCVVDNLQTYKIAWLRVDTQTILTIQNHVITKNHRMSITHAEKRAWILRIRDVKESDKGWYMCQINTDPMKSQVGYLDVVAVAFNGSFLTIAKVRRLNMGAYLCIASNGIPPTVSKRVMLIVHFPPMIWIQNQLVGAALTQNITLECQSEAYPKSINYWMKNDTIIVPGERFVPETFESGYKITMRLTIFEVDIQDFGAYRCVAKNSLGDTDGAIKLYHIPQTTTMTTMAPTVSINTVPVVMVKYNKEQRNQNANGNNNPYNYNPGIGQQNTKLQRGKSNNKGLDQSSSGLNNVFVGATSSLWNSQDHLSSSRGRDHHQQQHHQQQQQSHGSDHSASYRSDGKSPHPIKHDAKSLTDDLDRMQDLKGWAHRLAPCLPILPILTLSLILGSGYLGAWPG
ncbi:uncharacterized protein LOC108043219 isoform X4 [Drosophila rhopaloa]|uniref:Ig-like domain-containing protein n=1 Tax=Drosophila rhopaloa TaxID=1041015 RepID=A0ABM5JBL3_DRORH|nr:uncharacterized protein LOC108043219 isoform X4 [Drosophila rhopaloa]